MRKRADGDTYYLIVARCTDLSGVPRCLNCGSPADDVHEILPRSFFGPKKQEELFAENNRCCLCRSCHSKVHNDYGRGRLLYLMSKKHSYRYGDGLRKCLLEDYLMAEQ